MTHLNSIVWHLYMFDDRVDDNFMLYVDFFIHNRVSIGCEICASCRENPQRSGGPGQEERHVREVKKSLGSLGLLGGWKCSKATTGIYWLYPQVVRGRYVQFSWRKELRFKTDKGTMTKIEWSGWKSQSLKERLRSFLDTPRYCVQYARRSLFAGKTQGCMALWHRSISPFNWRIQSEIEELRRLWHVDYNDDGSILSIFRMD